MYENRKYENGRNDEIQSTKNIDVNVNKYGNIENETYTITYYTLL